MEAKLKRYTVTVCYTMDAASDTDALKQSKQYVGDLNKEQDCKAFVSEITEVKFGKYFERTVFKK